MFRTKRLQFAFFMLFHLEAVVAAHIEREYPESTSVYESPNQQFLLIAPARGTGVSINGRGYTRPGIFPKDKRGQPLYIPMDFLWVRAITGDGKYVVVSGNRSVAFAGAEFQKRFEVGEFYDDISVVPPPPHHKTIHPWINDYRFDDRSRRFFLETHEGRIFVIDMATGAILGVIGEGRPSFSVDIVRLDGTMERLSHFRQCGSAAGDLSDMALTGIIVGKAGTGLAADHVDSIPFAEVKSAERVQGEGQGQHFDVIRTNGEIARMDLGASPPFCARTAAGDRASVEVENLSALSHFQPLQPRLFPGDGNSKAKSKYLDSYQRAGDRHNWTLVPEDAYKLVDYMEFAQAAAGGDTGRIREFLSLGADPGQSWGVPPSALDASIANDQYAAAEFMLSTATAINFDPEDPILDSAVQRLARVGENEVLARCISLLLGKGANPYAQSTDQGPPLFLLLHMDRVDLVETFLEHGVDANSAGKWNSKPLQAAKSVAAVELLVKHGADPDVVYDSGDTLLYDKVNRGDDPEVISSLLRGGANPNIQRPGYSSVLKMAFNRKDRNLIELLLKHGATQSESENLIYEAVDTGQFEVAELLLVNGADPNQRDFAGRSAIFEADSAGVIDLLARHGADVNVRNGSGHSPLYQAVLGGKNDLAEALLQAGANPNQEAGASGSLLGHAVWYGNVEVVSMLVRHGADIDNSAARRGKVMHAAVIGSTEILQVLLDAGANPNVVDGSGQTPMQVLCKVISDSKENLQTYPEYAQKILGNFELLAKYSKNPPPITDCRKSS